MDKWLFQRIDNTGLALWRIFFGLLISLEAFGAILTGWVRVTLVEPEFTFNFIGFDYLQPLPGNGMYFYFFLMGCFGLMVMMGYKYRWSMAAYALMWTCVYLMQKTAYNNHYYLMMLLCWLMVFFPANRYLSIDAKRSGFKRHHMPRWVKVVFIGQIWIVFTYAGIAKIYPGWLDASVPALFMRGKIDYWLIGDLLQQAWLHSGIAYFGLFFDLLIIPLLLWRKTRLFGFYLSLFFHLFNSFVFQVGIFPYMSIAFALFFFPPKTLIEKFKLKRSVFKENVVVIPPYKKFGILVFGLYLIVQFSLPLRHWFFKDDVLWTEEGHRLSWRMMLRSRTGHLIYWAEDKSTGERNNYPYQSLLSEKQYRSIKSRPDFIWQMAQRIKKREAEKGKDIALYVTSKVKINDGVYHDFIDPEVDLANEEWLPLKHHDWILPSPDSYKKKTPNLAK